MRQPDAARQGRRDESRVEPRVLQVYKRVRTAHLERARNSRSTTIIFQDRRDDFDALTAREVDLRQAGALGTFLHALRHRYDIVEINEPLMIGTAGRGLAAIMGNRLRAFVLGGRASIVTYAIENLHPAEMEVSSSWKARCKRSCHWLLLPLVWSSIDRLAFGTPDAERLYGQLFRARWPEHRVVLPLPAPRRIRSPKEPRPATLVFLGDLHPRKGFPEVLEAWQHVHRMVPDARLTILGSGEGEQAARQLAADDPAVTTVIRPERSSIFSVLAQTKVLVLPSQRAPRWREQVGLPIVEGLSAGCLIVTTTETGLSEWLAADGHFVLQPGDSAQLATAICDSLLSDRTPDDIIAALPAIDGRRQAELWMHGLRT